MKYTVKNFKVFDENGATFELQPVTILTGANNSGKSSVVKSMALLDTLIRDWQDEFSKYKAILLKNKKLDFKKYTQFALGTFNKVLHRGTDNKTLTFEYELQPTPRLGYVNFFAEERYSRLNALAHLYNNNVRLSFDFTSKDEIDLFNNGHLINLSIYTNNNELIFSTDENRRHLNYNLLKNAFFQLLSQLNIIYIQAKLHDEENEFKYTNEFGTNQEVNGIEQEIVHLSKKLETKKIEYLSSFGTDFIDLIENSPHVFAHAYRDYNINKDWRINEDVIKLAQKLDVIFVFPLLEKIWNYTRENFYSNLIELCSTKEISDEIQIGIDDIADDFESSSFNTFGEYFKKMESEFLDQTKTHNWGLNLALPSSMTYPVFGLGSSWGDSYLQFAARINGPKFHDMPDGSATPAYTKEDIERWKNRTVDFSIIYQVLTYLNVSLGYDLEWTNGDPDDIISTNAEFPHRLYEIFQYYAKSFLSPSLIPAIPTIDYWSSNTLDIRRAYPLDDRKGIGLLLKQYMDAIFEVKQDEIKERHIMGRLFDDFGKHYTPHIFINKWLKEFEIADSISILPNDNDNTVIIELYKTNEDRPYVLADLGSGVTQLISILIRIETEIIRNDYAISPSIIALEEPEAHLHPNYQSKLADMLLDAAENYNVHFIVETHSEYLIRKAQVLVAEKNYVNENELNEKNSFKIYYVPNDDKPYEMKFKSSGRFENSFGEGFFDEAGMLNLITLRKERSKK